MSFTYIENERTAKIKVIGVGGAGGNAINNMIDANLQGVKFIVANTDAQALDASKASVKIQLGSTLTEGLGAGANPEVGRDAAMESEAAIREALKDSHMIFITAGLGGGTGTGAAPVVARIAKELGALTVAVTSKPFNFEGKKRLKQAEAGLEELKKVADTVITIPNDRLRIMANKSARMVDMFKKADEILNHSVKGITDLIMVPGLVSLDFADVRTTMKKAGMAMMGIGTASGENRAMVATEAAIGHPLLADISIAGAKGLLMNITSTSEVTMDEVTQAMDRIYEEVGEDAEIIWGHTIDETLGDTLHVTVIATGIRNKEDVQTRANNVILHRTQNPRPLGSGTRGKIRDVTAEDLANPSFHDSGVIQRQKVVGNDFPGSLQDMPESRRGNINRNDLEIPTFLRRKAD